MAASWTACWNFWRSRLSSSIVSVPTIERSEPSRTFLTIESTSLVLGVEEALGGVPDRLVVGADLERRDALDRDLDALPGDGVGELDVDLAGGELEPADLVEQRQHDRALAADDLEARSPPPSGARAARTDQRLVRAGDLVAAAEVRDEQDDDDDRRGRRRASRRRGSSKKSGTRRSLRRPDVLAGSPAVMRVAATGATISPVPAIPVTVTVVPAGDVDRWRSRCTRGSGPRP